MLKALSTSVNCKLYKNMYLYINYINHLKLFKALTGPREQDCIFANNVEHKRPVGVENNLLCNDY